ncbi:hypothetical protein GQX74_004865, partial [Glossina fuscipes]
QCIVLRRKVLFFFKQIYGNFCKNLSLISCSKMNTLGPKEDGGPNVEFFNSPESLQGFETIRLWLQKNCKKQLASEPITKESLAQLLIQFLQYVEAKLGKNSTKPPATRIPMRCFMDFKPNGGLCYIFAAMFRFRDKQKGK